MNNDIVVGVNGSDHSYAALDWAVDRAVSVHRPLTIVSVVEDSWTGPGYLDESLIRDSAGTVLDAAAQHAAGRAPELVVSTRLEVGDPVVRLSAIAPKDGLLVLGAHRLGRIGGVLTAPVGVRVAAAAHSAVALVPPDALEVSSEHTTGSGTADGGAADGGTAERRLPRSGVVVGVDGSPASLEAVAFAAAEADRRGESLLAVHAWQLPGTWSDAILVEKPVIDAIEEDEELRLAESLVGLGDRYPDLVIERRLVRGGATAVLSEYGRTARMLVVGSHGRNALTRLLLGSVSHSLALTMCAPLVVLRHSSRP